MKIYKTDKETGNLLLVTPQEFLSDKNWTNNGYQLLDEPNDYLEVLCRKKFQEYNENKYEWLATKLVDLMFLNPNDKDFNRDFLFKEFKIIPNIIQMFEDGKLYIKEK